MAKGQITGVVLKEGALEWTSMQCTRDRWQTIETSSIDITTDVDATEEERAATVSEKLKAASLSVKGSVVLGLSSAEILLRVVTLPAVDDDEMLGMVELQVDKFSPFPIESMVVSYEVLRVKDSGSVVLIGAVREEAIDAAGKMLALAGLLPIRVDATVLGWLRLLREKNEILADGCQAILLLDESAPEIIVLQDGTPVAFRALGDTRELDAQELASEMAHEIGYTLMSLELEQGAASLDKVSVWHWGEAPAGIRDVLADQCSCDVSVGSLESLPPLSEGIAQRFPETGPGVMDLTPSSWRKGRASKELKKQMFTAAGVILGVLVALMLGLFGTSSYLKWQLRELEQEQSRWSKPAFEVRGMRRRVAMISRYTNTTHSALECLRDITARMPPRGIDLTSFVYKKGASVKITGEADSANIILDFTERLNGSPLFAEIKSGQMSFTRKKKHRFSTELMLPGDR